MMKWGRKDTFPVVKTTAHMQGVLGEEGKQVASKGGETIDKEAIEKAPDCQEWPCPSCGECRAHLQFLRQTQDQSTPGSCAPNAPGFPLAMDWPF